MADAPGIVAKLTEALNAKGVGAPCPMCQQNEWMIQDEVPYSRMEVTDVSLVDHRIFKGFYPTYWMYCGHCGFVAQFMKSIVDGKPDPGPKGAPA